MAVKAIRDAQFKPEGSGGPLGALSYKYKPARWWQGLSLRASVQRALAKSRLKKVTKKLPLPTSLGKEAQFRRGLSTRILPYEQEVERRKQAGEIRLVGGINIVSGRKWRGAAGPLGDVVIVEILPTPLFIMEAQKQGSSKGLGGKQTNWETAWKQLNQFYHSVVQKTKDWIGFPFPRREGHVPTDTGKLRKAMWESMEREWGSKTQMPMNPQLLRETVRRGKPILTIVLNTKNLKYANPVNTMPTQMLAHPHQGSRNFGRAGPLFDPSAVIGWFHKAAAVGRDRARAGAGRLYLDLGAQNIQINYW